MRKVKIITDSCADLSAEQLEKYDIDYARMSTIEDGKESPALTVAATLCSPLLLLLFKAPVSVILIDAAIVIFVALRHKENFRRLKAGTESKFTLSTH